MASRTRNFLSLLKEVLWDTDEIEIDPIITISKSDEISGNVKKTLTSPIVAENILENKITTMRSRVQSNVKNITTKAVSTNKDKKVDVKADIEKDDDFEVSR